MLWKASKDQRDALAGWLDRTGLEPFGVCDHRDQALVLECVGDTIAQRATSDDRAQINS